MAKSHWKWLEWVSRAETVHVVFTSDIVRNLLWPTVSTVLTGAAGILGGVPFMWVMMGSALTFMAVTQSILRTDELKERKNPENKLVCLSANVSADLIPTEMPFIGNRKQRLAQRASKKEPEMIASNEIVYGVPRILDKAQVRVQVQNKAAFPISIILWAAETEIAELSPPRSTFPKKATTVPAGGRMFVTDDRIDMQKTPCGRLSGRLNMLIKYGRPGDEKFELHLEAQLDIVMEKYGMVNGVYANWLS